MSVHNFTVLIDKLLDHGKGDADLIQLSGGEPTIHPDFFEIVEIAIAKGIKQVYVNTNGIMLSQAKVAERLASYGPRISAYLQFDGFRKETLALLRGRNRSFIDMSSGVALNFLRKSGFLWMLDTTKV